MVHAFVSGSPPGDDHAKSKHALETRISGIAAALARWRSAVGRGGEPTRPPESVSSASRPRHCGLLQTMLQFLNVAVPAVCDILADRMVSAQDIVEQASARAPQAYTQGERDWQGFVERDDLDAVLTATPWQWHAPIMVAAMKVAHAATEVPAAVTLRNADPGLARPSRRACPA